MHRIARSRAPPLPLPLLPFAWCRPRANAPRRRLPRVSSSHQAAVHPKQNARIHLQQVQKVTPEELEVAIANRERAILVDFFGARRGAKRGAALPIVWRRRRGALALFAQRALSHMQCARIRKHAARRTLHAANPRLTSHTTPYTNNTTTTQHQKPATWCGPCLLLAQELEKVAEEMGGAVDILKLDVDENPELASQLQVWGGGR